MFSLNQAALLFIELFLMWHAFAEPAKQDQRDIVVSRGDSVMLNCSINNRNVTQISWTKGRCVFVHYIEENLTFSNFSSHRLKINLESPNELSISSVQSDDEGLYVCNVTIKAGPHSFTWNLSVSENTKETALSESYKYLLYTLPPAMGFLLCCIMSAVFLSRKIMRWTRNQGPVHYQFSPQSEQEVAPSELQGGTACRANKRRSQYIERLNSIYDNL